jgi:hypothetical protein
MFAAKTDYNKLVEEPVNAKENNGQKDKDTKHQQA